MNALRKLLESGNMTLEDLTPEDLASLSGAMPEPRFDIAPMRMNSMRVESGPDAGNVTDLDFRKAPPQWMQQWAQPAPMAQRAQAGDRLGAASGSFGEAPSITAWREREAAKKQAPEAPQGPQMRVVGYGNGQMTDLGSESGQAPAIDYTKGKVDIPGVGVGYYAKDGRYAVVPDGQGGMTKVLLGYDREGSMALNKADQQRRATEAQIAQSQASTEHTREQTLASQAQRTMREDPTSQDVLTKRYGKLPEGQRWRADGTVEDIPGAQGKLNENQGKSLTFGQRAAESHEVINQVGNGGEVQPGLIKRAAESVPVIGGALGAASNWTQSAAQQQVEQAQRNFINAVLRRESGASISPAEFDNARQQYFPQPGDSPAVIAQKAKNRETTIRGLAEEAGPGKRNVMESWQAARGASQKARADALQAIAAGADPAKVKARLRAQGYSDNLEG